LPACTKESKPAVVKKNTTLDEGLKRQEVGMDETKKKDGTLGRSFVERERASDGYFCLFFLFASSAIFTVKERLLDSPGAAKWLWNIYHLHYFVASPLEKKA
jgi:hypothetical protein